MLTGVNNDETVEYIVQDEQGKDNPTVFLIGNISNKDKIRLFAGAVDASGSFQIDKVQDKATEIVKSGLRGIRNIVDAKTGKAVDIAVINDAAIEMIPFVNLLEVMGKIIEFNFISKAEEKN